MSKYNVHLAGHRVRLAGDTYVRQRCSWCGVLLAGKVSQLVPEDHFLRWDDEAREDLGPSEGVESPLDACWFRDPAIREAREQARAVADLERHPPRQHHPGCAVALRPGDPRSTCRCGAGLANALAEIGDREAEARPNRVIVSEFDQQGQSVPPATIEEV